MAVKRWLVHSSSVSDEGTEISSMIPGDFAKGLGAVRYEGVRRLDSGRHHASVE
jgi:hypothetical protein